MVIRERTVRGGHSPSFVRLVDDVVVDEGARLIELQRRAEMGKRHLLDGRAGTERVAHVSHEGTETLSSGYGCEDRARELLGSAGTSCTSEEMGEAGGRRLVD